MFLPLCHRAGRHRVRYGRSQAPSSLVVSVLRCSSVRGVRVVLLVRLRLAGDLSPVSWPSTATAVPWLSAGREWKRGWARVGLPGLVGPGRERQAEGKGQERRRAWATCVPGWAERPEKSGSRPELPVLFFFFKNVNSSSFCLFQ
jgi:hypothetical protein